MSFFYKTAAHAKLYSRARPTYGPRVAKCILDVLGKQVAWDTCVDVGCGTGSSTLMFAPFFRSVIGCDTSETQLERARHDSTCGNVEYRLGGAEDLPVPDGAVQLVSAAQAIHWFDRPKFFKEADRVLTPGGCVAYYAYGRPEILHGDGERRVAINRVWRWFYDGEFVPPGSVADYWRSSRELVLQKYSAELVPPPYGDCTRDESIEHDVEYDWELFTSYIKSWSVTQNYISKLGETGLDAHFSEFKRKLHEIADDFPDGGEKFTLRYPFFIVIARKPSLK